MHPEGEEEKELDGPWPLTPLTSSPFLFDDHLPIIILCNRSEEMFVLTEMQDAVRLEPNRFSRDMGQELSDELNKKFANKVPGIVGILNY